MSKASDKRERRAVMAMLMQDPRPCIKCGQPLKDHTVSSQAYGGSHVGAAKTLREALFVPVTCPLSGDGEID